MNAVMIQHLGGVDLELDVIHNAQVDGSQKLLHHSSSSTRATSYTTK
jgi:hypothetical protein